MSITESIKNAINQFKENEPTKEEKVEESLLQKTPVYKRPMAWAIGIGAFFLARSLFGSEKRITVRGDMKLTRNFSLGEFLRSSSIPALREYKLTEKELENLKRLALILQSIRTDIGAPIYITSGGRPPLLKATTGKYKGMTFVEILKAKNYSPAEFSQHMDFSAADFTTTDVNWLPIIMQSMTNPFYQSGMGKTISQVILYIENGIPDFIHLGVASDIHNFIYLTTGKRLLLAKVTKIGKTRETKFMNFTLAKMKELTTLPPAS
jgi:hypothetical protein